MTSWSWIHLAVWSGVIYGFATAVAVLHVGEVLVRAPLAWLSERLLLFKPLALLSKCPACIAFWTGLLLSNGDLSPTMGVLGPYLPGTPYLPPCFDGFLALGSTWLLHVTQERLAAGLTL